MDAQASSSAPLLTQEEEIIDYHDDATIRGYVPWVYVEGLGFDENRAALTIMGNMPLRPALIKALRKRINEEMSDRGTARFATSLDILISYPKKDGSGDTKENLPLTPAMIDAIRLGQDLNNQPAIAPAQTGSMLERANSNPPCDHLEPNMVNKVNNKPEPKQPNIPVRGDGEKWTEDKTKLLISLHAQRKSFKDISASFPGKGVKSCQEHFYRARKVLKWRELHDELRAAHNGKDAVPMEEGPVNKNKLDKKQPKDEDI